MFSDVPPFIPIISFDPENKHMRYIFSSIIKKKITAT